MKIKNCLFLCLISLIFAGCFAPLDYNGRDNHDGTINIRISAFPLSVSRAAAFPEDTSITTDDLDFEVTFTNIKTKTVVEAVVTKDNESVTAGATILPGIWKISIVAKLSATNEIYALASETVDIQKSETITILMKRAVKVEFMDGIDTIDSLTQYVADGDPIQKPVDLAKPSYAFKGWYKDTGLTIPWDFSEPVLYTKSLVEPYILYSKWEVSVPVITINIQPASINVIQGSISGSLITAAGVDAAVSLSYQWHENTSADNSAGTAISNATGTSFTIPATLTIGTYYYFCEISAAGAASVRTNIATVTVQAPGTPVISITTQPAATTEVLETKISGSLTVIAGVTEGVTLSYQWYENSSANNSGGTEISGANGAAFTIPTTLVVGTNYYYYCVVSATGNAAGVPAPLPSNAATVTVIKYGTAGNPFTVNNITELGYVGKGTANPAGYKEWTLTAHYKQTANITLSGTWTPIGVDNTAAFAGSYDGDGYTISNLTITATTTNQGMFGYINNGGVVRNLGLVGINILSNGTNMGGITGQLVGSGSKVENCYVTGEITSTNSSGRLGGMVGLLSAGTVNGCYTTATLKGTAGSGNSTILGGIAGTIQSSAIISNCVALNDSITLVNNTGIGRITGSAGGTLSNNYAWNIMDTRSGVSGDGSGGSLITITSNATQKDGLSKSAEDIKAAASNWPSSFQSAPWTWNGASGMPSINNRAGQTWPSHLTVGIESSPYQIADDIGLRKVGTGKDGYTLLAHYKQTADIPLSGTWTPIGADSTTAFAGSYDGDGYTITGIAITATTTNQGMFGFINNGGVVRNLGLVGIDISSGGTYIGGITGQLVGSGSKVENCYVTGSLTSTNSSNGRVGGVVGHLSGGTVNGCFVTATLKGTAGSGSTTILGGIAGSNSSGTTISNCVALNDSLTLMYNNGIGRIISGNGGTLSNNYAWSGMELKTGVTTITPTNGTTQKDGLGKTATELKDKGTWETAGFLFTDSLPTAGPWVWDSTDTNMPSLRAGSVQAWPTHLQ